MSGKTLEKGVDRPSAEVLELRRLLHRWVRVVGWKTRRRRGQIIAPEDYRVLHEELLHACDSARKNSSGNTAALIEQIEHLVHPWVSMNALENAHKRIVADLWNQSRLLERELSGRKPAPRWVFYAILSLVTAAIGAGIVQVVILLSGEQAMGWLNESRNLGYRISLLIKRASFMDKVAVVTAIVLLVGIHLLRSTRKY